MSPEKIKPQFLPGMKTILNLCSTSKLDLAEVLIVNKFFDEFGTFFVFANQSQVLQMDW